MNTVHTFSEDIGMTFGIKKCGVLVLKRRKVDKVNSRGLKSPKCKVDENDWWGRIQITWNTRIWKSERKGNESGIC